MPTHTPFMQNIEQLPETLPIFPLANAVVLPGGLLPLNIFEPRYLNMTQDAMETHHLIGMIQPRDDSNEPDLFQVGCAGRITRYQETYDGRLEIVLTGLIRFRVMEELSTTRGYRLIKPEWSDYIPDLNEVVEPDEQDKSEFNTALRSYLDNNKLEADWSMIEKLNSEQLTNSLVGLLPLSDTDKQMLIETDTLAHRLRAFTAILEGDNQLPNVQH
ncbi:MAG: LON peptidase substrate-binding domain-containing protein [Gammaproteobacteria bacterium]|nr:LON peptidase substrate-binding domain-containing protein [Gammaproteobacteria bacterium]